MEIGQLYFYKQPNHIKWFTQWFSILLVFGMHQIQILTNELNNVVFIGFFRLRTGRDFEIDHFLFLIILPNLLLIPVLMLTLMLNSPCSWYSNAKQHESRIILVELYCVLQNCFDKSDEWITRRRNKIKLISHWTGIQSITQKLTFPR
jgi:hypothetical protein